MVVDYILVNSIDVCAITESWLQDHDQVIMSEITPEGYKLITHNRKVKGGGGIAVIHKDMLKFVHISKVEKESYEYIELLLSSGSVSVRLFIIYHAPYSSTHKVTTGMFYVNLNCMWRV